jgi:putative membrane protein
MGAADVVPGVSGGTIAFVTGIYPRLLNAIEAFNLEFFSLVLRFRPRRALALIPWGFLLPLLAGIGASIFSLARAVTYALATWPVEIWSFFFGLILASILLLSREIRLGQANTWVALVLGTAFGWLIGGAHTVDIGQSMPIYFISGFVAICAMILPGISGAFILVILGQYARIIQAVAELDFAVLAVFASGCAVGITSFARVLNLMLKKWPNAVMAGLTGIMVGCLRTLWPWKSGNFPAPPPAWNRETLAAFAFCLIGMAIPIALSALAHKRGRGI